jgi:uncharacterized protein (TIGR02391 family)
VTIAWNDLEILRIVDEAEQGKRTGIFFGRDLISAAAAERDQGTVTTADQESFVRELLVLQHAELLTWQVMSSLGRVQPISPDDPNDYLQNIREFTLSYEGHNQARGRVILTPLPDPTDDDGHPIATLTLEDIAKCIGRKYAPHQAVQLLIESGISFDDNPADEGETWEKLFVVFMTLEKGVSGQRRELRHFVAAWFDDQLRIGPSDEERDRLEPDLERQGWFVKDGRLVSGEPVRKRRDAAPPTPTLDQLHPMVWAAAAPQWKVQHLPDAVMEAAKAVNAMLEAKAGRSDVSEVKLVTEAFSDKAPTVGARRLRFPSIEGDQTRASVTVGVMNFGVGCFKAIRNPIGHLPDDRHDMTKQEALEQLAAWSLFARWIDRADVVRDQD